MVPVRSRSWIGLSALAALCLTTARAADGPPPPVPPKPARPKPCSTPEFRQFDFWIGDWSVVNPQGRPVGKNSITLEHDGCVLAEHWTGAAGGTGSSFNLYDAATKRWHQTWVDNSGTLLELDGVFADGKMVLEGKGVGPKGEPVTNRIAWEKLADGRVRQTWTTSSDGGATWSVAFDGFYSKP
jgi:hypothetical protein